MLHLRAAPLYAGLTIGLLGGSFNPAHDGHREISRFALKRLGLNQVWWLVSPQNPLKPTRGMASLEQRVREAKRIARHPKIIVTDIEAQLGTRYTVDTLRALRRRFPHTRFVWLMGADNMQQMPRWRDWADIFALVPVAVFPRPAYAAGRGKAAQRFTRKRIAARRGKVLAKTRPPVWLILDNRLNALSATDIRRDKATWQK